MDEPRFGRMWRRRAFGIRRSASRKALDRAEAQQFGLGALVEAFATLAAKIGLRLRARRARLRLVKPEEGRAPAPVDPAVVQAVRLDARGLQHMLEVEYLRRRPASATAEDQAELERLRRLG